MYQAQVQDNEPQLTPNQVAVIHFLDALKVFHPDNYQHWFCDGLRQEVISQDNYMASLGFDNINNYWLNTPATWRNQAIQCSILLQGENQ